MDRRLLLQSLLEVILGLRHVYFQPPANVQMLYPAIVYKRDDIRTEFAGNLPYMQNTRYEVTVIDRDPESPALQKMNMLPLCSFSRHFAADDLNHDVYSLYF